MISDIKLVIWDLDETFWNGTLSEGPIEAIPQNLERVKELCNRGVMNSICSKNEFHLAQAELEKLDVWDYFVFPSIMWAPKGQQVGQIVERMKLRPANVLVIDDNALNREEIKYYNNDINVLDPVDWADIDSSHWGKNDRAHKRLNNYKLLETKLEAATAFVGDNENFLRNSNIRCRLSVLDLANDDLDRVIEVLNRTNQLNFTKRRFRSGVAQLIHELRRSQSISYIVHVVDDYGDYGLCGFVSVSSKGIVQDFAFSCRLLDMGVERAILQLLSEKNGSLRVPFRDEIQGSVVDWVSIEEVEGQDEAQSTDVAKTIECHHQAMMPEACFGEVIAPFMQPEIAVVSLPQIAPLAARIIRKERLSSIIYWSGDAPELQRLFKGDYDLLSISVRTEVMFPTVWLPVFGYVPLPMTANTSILKQHSELFAVVKQIIADRGEYTGRRLEENKLRREISFCLAISKIPFVARQSVFSSKRYLEDLSALRDRLPDCTKLAIRICSDASDQIVFNGPWAALNLEFATRARAANNVVREFAKIRHNVFLLEPVENEDRSFDDFGHVSHKQYFEIAQVLKSQFLSIMERPAPILVT